MPRRAINFGYSTLQKVYLVFANQQKKQEENHPLDTVHRAVPLGSEMFENIRIVTLLFWPSQSIIMQFYF